MLKSSDNLNREVAAMKNNPPITQEKKVPGTSQAIINPKQKEPAMLKKRESMKEEMK